MSTILAKNIKAIRKSLGKSQDEFAAMLGAKRGALAQWELGNNKPGVDAMFALCKIANKTKEELEREPLVSGKEQGTPVYDLHASATQVGNVSQLPEVPSFHVNVPGYEDCNFGLYVYGHSMYPTIENGSLILCKRIQDKSLILFGEIYLIKTRDYLVVKRLQKGTVKKAIQCVSDNREKNNGDSHKFENFDLDIDKIIDLYLVKGIIKKTQS